MVHNTLYKSKIFSEILLILRKNEQDTMNVYWSSCNVAVMFVRLQ